MQRGFLTVEQLETALRRQSQPGNRKLLGEILVDLELCSEDQVVECLAMEYGVPYAKLDPRMMDLKAASLLEREYVEKNLVLPLFCIRGVLTIAVSEPANLFLIDELASLTEKQVQIVAATAKDIRRMITNLPNSKVFVIDDIIEDSDQTEVTLIEEAIDDIGDIEEIAGQSPVIRLVNYVIFTAVKEGASDIHIEPAERCMRVRNRIDGKLYKALEAPFHLHNAVTSRIKIMASLDISERRLPQDGRVHVMLDGRKIDLRISTFPGRSGEKTVIRVLDTRSVSLNLRDLGFAEDVLSGLQASIHAPNGIVLVTGPTGSGKSTTLYAGLNEIATMANNVCTVEDPIEYHLPLINQFQVQERVGLTFSKALRTLLRQDPDVIMLGEIRDEETARTAIQAALTGHLVLSTLHTNDAASAITRLVNMGVEPYLISAALNMVLAQRLCRRVCARCKQEYEPPRTLRKALERMGYDIEVFHRGVGCRRCRNTGFSGRIGVHELLNVTDELRDAIVSEASIGELRRIALADGMITLKHDGFRKVREGITTVEEVLHIIGETVERNPARGAKS
ncbi:Type II secretion system protein E [Lignipirellula cremea]|uniref:Type II secretion system protein E n=1 Tax=Lignipirellula cremea TaxID=2528010 RepID=A0A518DWS7_9BACT|nr:Type II secretion system protein E [Lignipirellula cremea]